MRPSVKEQVEALGAKFIDIPYEAAEEEEAAKGVGGYAKPMPASWLARSEVDVAKRVAAADVVISTALIPGRAATVLVTEDMVKAMKPGSVLVDLACTPSARPPAPGCTRLHGANRWASHWLLECVVLGRTCAADIAATPPPAPRVLPPRGESQVEDADEQVVIAHCAQLGRAAIDDVEPRLPRAHDQAAGTRAAPARKPRAALQPRLPAHFAGQLSVGADKHGVQPLKPRGPFS